MKKILVIGERINDVFIYGTATRLGPDAVYPVFIPKETKSNPGGAANVVANLRSLAPEYKIDFICNYQPIIKTRYVDEKSNYILLRVDECDNVYPPISEGQILDIKNSILDCQYEAIVFSSYNKGFLNKNAIFNIARLAKRENIPTFADHKWTLGAWSNDIFITKINEKEYNDNLKEINNPAEYTEHLIITRGNKGIEYNGKIFPAKKVEVIDSSGCGDSVHSALVIKYLETKNIEESIKYANKVGAIAVSKKGVVAIKKEEVL